MLLNILYVINKNLFLFLLIYKREILLNILYYQKNKDLSTQKYRKELTPNITFQPNKIFVRNDLFEKIIKSCKATNFQNF